MKHFIGMVLCFVFLFQKGIAQKDSSANIHFSSYVELYYSYDFANPTNHVKPDFNYNHKRHNQPNINLAFIKANYQSKQIRSNLALMAGNYVQYNLSAEPNWAQPILEANIGIQPFLNKKIWLDAGVMPSHIGFESAIGLDCWPLTRSLLSENSPYYETGLKLNYTNSNDQFYMAFLILNGWQKMQLPTQATKPSFGMQFTYKPISGLTLNYGNFIGSDKPDSAKSFRVFHNLYAIYDLHPKWACTLGVDIGTDRTPHNLASWFSFVLLTKYQVNAQSKLVGRLEWYQDPHQKIIQTGTNYGFQVGGASVNYDYKLSNTFTIRGELKKYFSKDPIYLYSQRKNSQNTATIALAIQL